jgi:hypothetical protein
MSWICTCTIKIDMNNVSRSSIKKDISKSHLKDRHCIKIFRVRHFIQYLLNLVNYEALSLQLYYDLQKIYKPNYNSAPRVMPENNSYIPPKEYPQSNMQRETSSQNSNIDIRRISKL